MNQKKAKRLRALVKEVTPLPAEVVGHKLQTVRMKHPETGEETFKRVPTAFQYVYPVGSQRATYQALKRL